MPIRQVLDPDLLNLFTKVVKPRLDQIIHPMDVDSDWALHPLNYSAHASAVLDWKIPFPPEVGNFKVCEIGSRFGYSASAILGVLGGDAAEITCFDDELYVKGSNEVLSQNLSKLFPHVKAMIVKEKSQDLTDLMGSYDIIHVDGDHTGPGTRSDMTLAWSCLNPGGLMLVDDAWLHRKDIEDVVEGFVQHSPYTSPGLEVAKAINYVSYRGLYAIYKEKA
jgi:predicted O-methyltransferase YrrM